MVQRRNTATGFVIEVEMISRDRWIKHPRGFTMVEVLVAMAIAGIFLTVFVGVVVATFKTLRTGDERTVAQQNARVALKFIVRDIKQAVEIAPRRFEEPFDPSLGGLPRDGNSLNNYDDTYDAYPIYRRSTDGDFDGYIDLSHDGAAGDGDEYNQFRNDGKPYDIRPLAPNRLELLLNSDSYYSHSQYFGDNPETPVPDVVEYNLDIGFAGSPDDNQQALKTRVTYEHQIVPPVTQIYEAPFDGNRKEFKFPVNRQGALGVELDDEFCLVRSFETEQFDFAINSDQIRDSVIDQNDPAIDLNVDSYGLRQPIADHIIDVRFRYWHTDGHTKIEIRYDPDITNAYTAPDGTSGTPINTDDGYYRYFNQYGQEIYVWYHHDDGAMVDPVEPPYDKPEFDAVTPNSFYVWYNDDPGNEEKQRGILLFEGWRFINMISVTIRATNKENLDKFKKSIDNLAGNNDPDWQMGFIDFGKGTGPPLGLAEQNNPNILEPLYRAVDNYRSSTVDVNGYRAFDFVEPNINGNYDPNSFVTLEMFVSPPILKTIAAQNEMLLRLGFSYRSRF